MAGRLPAVVIDNGTGYAIRFICFPLNNKQEMHTSRVRYQGGRIFLLLSAHKFSHNTFKIDTS
uniref:Uncharacterized protein n=1 Tax=Magallana gigas TaxID=29159 RepID=K1R4H9_MAGGI